MHTLYFLTVNRFICSPLTLTPFPNCTNNISSAQKKVKSLGIFTNEKNWIFIHTNPEETLKYLSYCTEIK